MNLNLSFETTDGLFLASEECQTFA